MAFCGEPKIGKYARPKRIEMGFEGLDARAINSI
jgi:hypothetical protein